MGNDRRMRRPRPGHLVDGAGKGGPARFVTQPFQHGSRVALASHWPFAQRVELLRREALTPSGRIW